MGLWARPNCGLDSGSEREDKTKEMDGGAV